MYIAVLACSNGLGHTRRVVAIASFMLKNGFDGKIDAFLPVKHLNTLNNWEEFVYFKNHPSVNIFDFHYPKIPTQKTKMLFDKDWESIDLPDLSKYDVVWSDNILQVLEVRPDAKITGSFLWFEVFEQNKAKNGLTNFVATQKKLLEDYRPDMAGSEYFATHAVKEKTNFFPVGLYKYSTLLKEKNKKGILISCGLGGEEEEITRDAIKQIIEKDLRPPEKLYVEPRILPEKYPDWMVKAPFTSEMFHDCVAVCIRPGIGTISDALVHHARIYAFSRDESYEMLHNCEILEQLKVGERCDSPFDAYCKAIEFASSKEELSSQFLKTAHLRTDGVFATSNFILRQNI